ncbi:MAG: lipopolysaccharide biosynthesis protein [Lachnospiraceae bacterium]|nr:lipopolysaccharide biosynthesis protein [Lachnospiraceae bacterium]
MNRIAKHLLYHGKQIEKQNMVWNMVGSFVYAFASMVLSFLVMRIAGEDAGGIFAVGFSTFGQQMFTLAYFGLRPFQITDGGPEQGGYSFGEYRFHRKLTSGAALLAAAFFAVWMAGSGAYGISKSVSVFLLAVYKIIDGYADVYESEFQRRGSLYLTGKSNTFRTILSVSVFLAVLAGTRALPAACLAAAAAQLLGLWIFAVSAMKELEAASEVRGAEALEARGAEASEVRNTEASVSDCSRGRRSGSMKRLFSQSGLLFLSVFLDFYIFSAAKYAIDGHLNDAASGYFNLIFMPTSVIYLVANFVIRPFLTKMTTCWNRGELEEFGGILKKIGLIIGGLTVLAVGGTVLLGRFVLSVMELLLGQGYEGSLTVYLPAFVLVVLGGGIYAFSSLLYYSLVIMRRQKQIFGVYVVVAGTAALLAPVMVERFRIPGAALAYGLFMSMQVLGFGFWVLRGFCGEDRTKRPGKEAA